MTCLRCGRRIHTDIYHRLCRRCKIRNSEVSHRVGRVSSEVTSLLRRGGFDDAW
jgi:NMD protein affecting ribosome stability and mRNA decay